MCNYRKVQRIAERQRANSLHEQRWVKFHHDDEGALILEARLPPEAGAIVLEALAAAGSSMPPARPRPLEKTPRSYLAIPISKP